MFNYISSSLKNTAVLVGLINQSYIPDINYLSEYSNKIAENIYYYNLELKENYLEQFLSNFKELREQNKIDLKDKKNIYKFISNEFAKLIFKDIKNIDEITQLGHIYRIKLNNLEVKNNIEAICKSLEGAAKEDNFNVNSINNQPKADFILNNLNIEDINSEIFLLNKLYYIYNLKNLGLTPEHLCIENIYKELYTQDKLRPNGLANLGNTCFINSLLQALINLEPLKREVEELEIKDNKLAKEFVNFIKSYEHKKITQQLRSLQADFNRSAGLGDCDELFTKLLAYFDNYKKIQDLFTINIDSYIKIENILIDSEENSDKVFKLQIPLQEEKEIQDLNLDLYFNSDLECNKVTKISSAPEILAINLIRYSGNGRKLYNTVNFPFKLNINQYSEDYISGNLNYKLKSVVMHHGENYHYTAYVEKNGLWYHCNDSNISPGINEEQVKKIFMPKERSNINPYILFYVKDNKEEEILTQENIYEFINQNIKNEELKNLAIEKVFNSNIDTLNIKSLKNIIFDLIKNQRDLFFIKLKSDFYSNYVLNKKETGILNFYYKESIISLVKLKDKFPFIAIICDKDIDQDQLNALKSLHEIFIKPYQDKVNDYIKSKFN